MFDSYLGDQGLQARSGQIIDATLIPVPVPKQRNSRQENKEIKTNCPPNGWNERPKPLRQGDLDARWVKNNYTNYYGYRNSNSTDAEHIFIRYLVITPANINNDYLWADSAYSGERFKDSFSLAKLKIRTMRRAQEITLLMQLPQSPVGLGLKFELE